MCRICRVKPADSFEHVPPRKAFNDEPTTTFTIMEWLAREDGKLTGGKIERRGAGDAVLCQSCNNNTGSWYGRNSSAQHAPALGSSARRRSRSSTRASTRPGRRSCSDNSRRSDRTRSGR